MMNRLKISSHALVLSAVLCYLSGCATAPENIASAYVSELTYINYTADQLAQEQARLTSALAEVSDAQRRARSNDTLGVILLGLPVSSLSGSNQASQVARIKGELAAVQKAAILKGYSLSSNNNPSPGSNASTASSITIGSGVGSEPVNQSTQPTTRYVNLAPGTRDNGSTQLEKRLRALTQMKENGLITEEEYQTKRKEILGEL